MRRSLPIFLLLCSAFCFFLFLKELQSKRAQVGMLCGLRLFPNLTRISVPAQPAQHQRCHGLRNCPRQGESRSRGAQAVFWLSWIPPDRIRGLKAVKKPWSYLFAALQSADKGQDCEHPLISISCLDVSPDQAQGGSAGIGKLALSPNL